MWSRARRSGQHRGSDAVLQMTTEGSYPANRRRQQYLEVICGNTTTGPKPTNLDLGVNVYADYVEHCMRDFCTDDALQNFYSILQGPGGPNEQRIEQLFDISATVGEFLKELGTHLSIEAISHKILHRYEIRGQLAQEHIREAHQLVFACIGWTSMLFTPIPHPTLSEFCFSRQSHLPTAQRQASVASMRPIGALLRGYGVLPLGCQPPQALYSGEASLLAVSNLNYFSLKMLGDLSISWVENLACHGCLDESKKQLMLFRFPSLCSQIACTQADTTILGCICRAHVCANNCSTGAESAARAYLLEILLSYRLLFGQEKRSRKLFREKEEIRVQALGFYDPVLGDLCGRRTVPETNTIRSRLQERGAYSPAVDFPHLGKRLVELQNFSINQKPRRLVEVWNDHRDPQQSFTFWAVVIVGGVSIFLSLVQVLLQIAQLIYQIHSSH